MNAFQRVKQTDYLKGSLVLMTVILLAVACSPAEKSESQGKAGQSRQWEVGVALYSFNRFSFANSLAKAKKTGAKYVEGFSFHELGNKFDNKQLLELSGDQLEQMKKMIKARELKMRSMYAAAKTKSEWEQMFKIGQKLGLQFWVGEPKWQQLNFVDSLAAEYDIQVAIHQHAKGSSRYWHPDSVLAALDGRSNMGACADLGHWVRSGLDPVESLKKLEGHIISIHAKDLGKFGDPQANYVKMGRGVIDYRAVVKELQRQGFSGPVYVENECDGGNEVDEVRIAVSYLNRLRNDRSE